MKAQVYTDDLKNSLSRLLSVVDKKNARPVLSMALITARENQIELAASDAEISAKITIQGNVDKPGEFCVNPKNIFDILKEFPEPNVHLEINSEENVLNISCKNLKYSLLIHQNDDFPHLLFVPQEKSFNVSAKTLLNIIYRTSHAISQDETRVQLNGLYLQEVNEQLRVVATDGHRLSLIENQIDGLDKEMLEDGVIIPRKGVFELKKLAESNPDGDITLALDESFIYASSGKGYFVSIRLIARDYPRYQAVIPSKTTYSLNVEKGPLFDAIRRIKIMSYDKSNGLRMKLTENEMTLMANHPSLGRASEKLPIHYDGKEMEIGFNAKYLVETLSTFDDGDIALELNNELSPILIKSRPHNNYLGLVMPMKL